MKSFESIKMFNDECFDEFYAKLNDIVNSAYNLGEIYDQPKIVRKIFRSLTKDFRPKVTIITESKDVNSIPINELVRSLQSYELDLPKTNKSKSMALKSVDDVDGNGFDDELSSIEIVYLAKNFRNFLRNNNRRARGKNNAEPRNFKRNEPTKVNNTNKSKERVGQNSNNSMGQQCFGCQGHGHVKSKCPTFLRSKGKAMAVTLGMMKFLAISLVVMRMETSLLSQLLLSLMNVLRLMRTLLMGNSLRMLICKKPIISFVRLLQRML